MSDSPGAERRPYRLPDVITDYYGLAMEDARLGPSETPRLEALRTRVLLDRYLPAAPATVYDIGGGTGAYACPLARAGYRVHLVDPVAAHVDTAIQRAAASGVSLASATVGDARAIDAADASADAVLLFGPLYHLTAAEDRLAALAEAHRLLRPGGVLLAAAISRFASLHDGLAHGWLTDPVFAGLLDGVRTDGVHRNTEPARYPQWFTLAYFHRPAELAAEVRAAGFDSADVLAVEGPGSFRDDLDLADPVGRAAVLAAIESVEAESSLLGASSHLMAVARRPAAAWVSPASTA